MQMQGQACRLPLHPGALQGSQALATLLKLLECLLRLRIGLPLGRIQGALIRLGLRQTRLAGYKALQLGMPRPSSLKQGSPVAQALHLGALRDGSLLSVLQDLLMSLELSLGLGQPLLRLQNRRTGELQALHLRHQSLHLQGLRRQAIALGPASQRRLARLTGRVRLLHGLRVPGVQLEHLLGRLLGL